MLYSCTHMAAVGVKGLIYTETLSANVTVLIISDSTMPFSDNLLSSADSSVSSMSHGQLFC